MIGKKSLGLATLIFLMESGFNTPTHAPSLINRGYATSPQLISDETVLSSPARKMQPAYSYNKLISIIGQTIAIEPFETIFLENSGLDTATTRTKTINGKIIELPKSLGILNPTANTEYVEVSDDGRGKPLFNIENVAILNGSFVAYSTKKDVEVRCAYGLSDVIPISITSDKFKDSDTIRFVQDSNSPPYFISSKLREKKEITGNDIFEVMKSYENMLGDYFNTSPKTLVCTDQLILPMLAAGINIESLMTKYRIPGNSYKHRNINSLLSLLDAMGVAEQNVHNFMDGDKKKIFDSEGYDLIIPENFGLEKFEEGMGVIFTRYYLTGPNKGKEQRTNVHLGMISEVKGNKITKVAMVTSRSSKPPYTNNIMSSLDNDFKYWYDGLRSEYIGSDETSEALTYRVKFILDVPKIATSLKAISDNN